MAKGAHSDYKSVLTSPEACDGRRSEGVGRVKPCTPITLTPVCHTFFPSIAADTSACVPWTALGLPADDFYIYVYILCIPCSASLPLLLVTAPSQSTLLAAPFAWVQTLERLLMGVVSKAQPEPSHLVTLGKLSRSTFPSTPS